MFFYAVYVGFQFSPLLILKSTIDRYITVKGTIMFVFRKKIKIPNISYFGNFLIATCDRVYRAIDCEMVGVGEEGRDSILARVSFII